MESGGARGTRGEMSGGASGREKSTRWRRREEQSGGRGRTSRVLEVAGSKGRLRARRLAASSCSSGSG